MKRRVVRDLHNAPDLTRWIIEYSLHLEKADEFLDEVLKLWNCKEGSTERLIHFARYLCDASFSPRSSERIADFTVGRIVQDDDRPGIGYARGLLLLALHKHGKRRHREMIVKWASVDTLKDEQLRVHFLYVFVCRQELDEELRLALVQLISSDTDLLLRLCERALNGEVARVPKILRRYVRVRGQADGTLEYADSAHLPNISSTGPVAARRLRERQSLSVCSLPQSGGRTRRPSGTLSAP
jgi:hypothetical protein